jgi:hypothetical protein
VGVVRGVVRSESAGLFVSAAGSTVGSGGGIMSKDDGMAVGDGAVGTSSTGSGEVLPAPTGPHRVGRVCDNWVDPERLEIYSTDPDGRRELVVWI